MWFSAAVYNQNRFFPSVFVFSFQVWETICLDGLMFVGRSIYTSSLLSEWRSSLDFFYYTELRLFVSDSQMVLSSPG